MCGLIGTTGPVADPEAMLNLIAHRGPDGRGFAQLDYAFLGHTRLAIQDTSDASSQPFTCGPITLTYNGELWNADDLHVPRQTTGDTEVVAAMLAAYGTEGLVYLDGMWAIAWHDERDGCVRLARDPFGKIPLYLRENEDWSVSWASEYKALPPGATRPVAPGEILCIPPNGSAFTEGWIPQPDHLDVPEPCPEAVRSLLGAGVRERLVGDRPIAYMLSGGLDSTFILGLVREQHPDTQVVAYTAALDPSSRDLAEARWVADHFGVELVEVKVPPVTPQRIREAVRAIEVPMKAQVEIALAHLPVMEAMASDGFRVCLSGEAADELFGGYGGMQIKASRVDDAGYQKVKQDAVDKMARGNFIRVNKVGMAYGVECRLPFMERRLVQLAVGATKEESPPGKKLLKLAARGLVPDRIIRRPKETFQGATGAAGAASEAIAGNPVTTYNQIARQMFGQLPKG